MVKMRKVPPINWFLRALFLALFASFLLDMDALLDHFSAHFLGSIEGRTITGEWHIVLLNVLLFSAFLIPLSFRKRFDWRSSGLVVAFFISLFVEMYGLSFTVLFASRLFGGTGPEGLDTVLSVSLLGVDFLFTAPMVYGSLLMLLGTVFVVLGWVTLYRGVKRNGLVTWGVYSISRHPQYLGFIIVIAGWLVGWPTLLNCIFSTVLIVFYIRVCRKEEREMTGSVPEYRTYMDRTPFLI